MHTMSKGLEYPKPSIAGGATKSQAQIRPAQRLTDDQVQRIREVAQRDRLNHPLPPGVAVELVFRR